MARGGGLPDGSTALMVKSASSLGKMGGMDDAEFCLIFKLIDERHGNDELTAEDVGQHWLKMCYARNFVDTAALPDIKTANKLKKKKKNSSSEMVLEDNLEDIASIYGLTLDDNRCMSINELRRRSFDIILNVLSQVLHCCFAVTKDSSNRTFVHLKLTNDGAAQIAHILKYPLQLDRKVAQYDYFKNNKNFSPPYHPFDFNAELSPDKFVCVQKIGRVWARYSPNDRKMKSSGSIEASQSNPSRSSSQFRQVDRIRLTDAGVKQLFNLSYLASDFSDFFVTSFPMHDLIQLNNLKEDWATMGKVWTTSQPIEKIRRYFGEGVALYFDWMTLYTTSLYAVSAVGVIFGVLRLIFDPGMKFQTPWLDMPRILYSFFLCAWSTWLCQAWKRREGWHAACWGTDEFRFFRSETCERQDFKYVGWIKDPVKPDVRKRYFPMSRLVARRVFGLVLSMVATVTCFIVCSERVHEKLLRYLGVNQGLSDMLSTFTMPEIISDNVSASPLFTAGCVQLFTYIFNWFVRTLTDFENYQYDDEYEEATIIKLFSLTGMDFITPLLYLAFVKSYMEPCYEADPENGVCLFELQRQIFYILIFSIGANFIELGYPFIMNMFFLWKANHSQSKESSQSASNGLDVDGLSQGEKEYQMAPYDNVTDDFQEMTLQLLMVSLFSSVFPFLPICAVVLNHLEIRVDALKLSQFSQRPFPRFTRSIGTWLSIMQVISVLSIVVNIAMCAFSTFGRKLVLEQKLAICILGMLVAFISKDIIEYVYPGQSNEELILIQQQAEVMKEAMWGGSEKRRKGQQIMEPDSNVKYSSNANESKRHRHHHSSSHQ